jgi:hypothetical protein
MCKWFLFGCHNFFMKLSLGTLDTTALTKAQLADASVDQLGLNKREAKDFIDVFLKSCLLSLLRVIA